MPSGTDSLTSRTCDQLPRVARMVGPGDCPLSVYPSTSRPPASRNRCLRAVNVTDDVGGPVAGRPSVM